MTTVRRYLASLRTIAILGVPVILIAATSFAEEPEEPACTACHQELTEGKSVHQALAMGCTACHTAVDASDVPHTITNRNPRGLSQKIRDLCYSCHDKKPFMKNTVHGAISLGCTSCHDPHASGHARLLKEDIPALCLRCHEERFTSAKNKGNHAARNEMCSKCHDPHSTDTPKLFVSGLRDGSPGRPALVMK